MLISENYQKLNKELHEQNPNYGAGKAGYVPFVVELVGKYIKEREIESVLDFGCGKGAAKEQVAQENPSVRVFGFDPAIEEFNAEPPACDIVFSTDVMEHVEPEYLEDVLKFIAGKTKHRAILIIATGPAQKSLPDGRNAHLIVENMDWWSETIAPHMKVLTAKTFEHAGLIIAAPHEETTAS